MSFGLIDENDAGCDSLRKAVNEAAGQSILMFAAASNNGFNSIPAFPARHNAVFCIFAADGNGGRGPVNPKAEAQKFNFSTLGQAVNSAWPTKLDHTSWKRKSGTSFATPVAAGIAASILLYARQNLSVEEADRLRSHDKMQKMLRYLSDSRDGYNVISIRQLERHEHTLSTMKEILAGLWKG